MLLKTAARRLLRNRRAALGLSLAGLALTLLASFLAGNPQTVGPTMLLPWLALLAFEVGSGGGFAAAVATFVVWLVSSRGGGFDITPVFVIGRLAAFSLIGLGVGLAGETLRESEGRSRRLVEGLPLVMYTEDSSGLTYISPQIESVVGYPPAAWLSDDGLWQRSLYPDDRERVLSEYADAVAAGGAFQCDYRLIRADGAAVWVRDASDVVVDGKRSYRQGFIVDVTERKESQRKLERNATLMRGLINRTVDGITLTDREGRITIANEPMLRFARELGLPSHGLIHERLLALADRMTQPVAYAQRMRELAAAPFAESFDEFELRDSGRAFQGFTRAVIGDDGAFLGRVWTLREVTAEREVERVKDALLATVSHELRTPLTSVIGYLELVGTGGAPLTEDDERFIAVARRNAARLHRMVDDLLFLARVDAGALSLDLGELDLVEAARHAVGSARPLAEAKHLTLELDDHPPAYVDADESRIAQVLDNLISNAVKFTDAGGTIRVSITENDGVVHAAVTDSGCGIPTGEQDKLFQRFFRSSITTHESGTGLGLAIVKAIVDGHGGSITVDSAQDRGTSFRFALPAKPARTDARAA